MEVPSSTRRLRYVFLEVGRFDKALEDCHGFEEQFLYVMKNLSTFAARPKGLDGSYFDEFFKAATFASLTAEDKQTYRKTMGTINDYLNTIDYAREEGREEGRVEEREEMVRRMKEKGIHIETIAEISGLTVEQIKALQECPKMSAEPTRHPCTSEADGLPR